MKPRLLLADRIKQREDSFLAPLMPFLDQHFDVRFINAPPGQELADALAWAEIVWLEWCWDHAVWATRGEHLNGRKCVLRLHSIEALQTDFPSRVGWERVDRLITVGDDIAEVLLTVVPHLPGRLRPIVIPNGIDMDRFTPGEGDPFRVGWVGHIEPKKNPMLLLQIVDALHRTDQRFSVHVAGPFTDLRTARYMKHMVGALGVGGVIRFDGKIADMPAWYADKGVILSTSMYESFGLNIGEAMAVGAFPVVHDFPGAQRLWPGECLFASVDQAVALIREARTGLYRGWVGHRFGLSRQAASILELLAGL